MTPYVLLVTLVVTVVCDSWFNFSSIVVAADTTTAVIIVICLSW
jgi:hypothetical protein